MHEWIMLVTNVIKEMNFISRSQKSNRQWVDRCISPTLINILFVKEKTTKEQKKKTVTS